MAAALLLDYAIEAERSGDFGTAERFYRAVLDERPEDAELTVRLGLLLHRAGRAGGALGCLQRAVALRPAASDSFGLLGTALAKAGRHAEAATAFARCVALCPERAESHLGLGHALSDLGRPDDAAECYGQAARLAPDMAEAHFLRAVALQSGHRVDEAAASYRAAIALDPHSAKAHANLGICLVALERCDEAVVGYRRAAAIDPADPRPLGNLGNALQRLGRTDEALAAYDAALEVDPRHADAHYNRGTLLNQQDRVDEAVLAYRRALCLAPGFGEAYGNLGVSFYRSTQLDASIAVHRRAVQIDPADADAHFNLAHSLLLAGALEEGFAEWEWRWQVPDFPSPRRDFRQPRWDGRPFPGEVLLVHAEQGHGDSLQFCRYLPLAATKGGSVVFECDAALAGLLGQLPGVDAVVESGQPLPAFDLQVPLLSLPALFGTKEDTIPADIPYLRPAPERLAHWRHIIGDDGRLRVGLVWAGNPRHGNDRHRSLPVERLCRLPWPAGVALHSLQKGVAEGQWAAIQGAPAIVDLGGAVRDFADLAAAIASLDLVISVDTAAAHLAGALGKPVWTLLPFAPDWRWRLDVPTTPWHPTMRLFRQRRAGDWQDVLDRVAVELAARTARQELRSGLGKNDRNSPVGDKKS